MPEMVPPVPTPAITMSTAPSVSSQISTAVVAWCTAGLAGLSNWLRSRAPRSSASSLALAMAPPMPSGPGVSTSSAP